MGTLSKLADTFAPEEQDTVLDALGGFKRDIQVEILESNGGDVDRVMDPRDQTMEGAFDVRKCPAGLCFDLLRAWKERIRKALREGTEVQLPPTYDEAR